jgi:predicted permease
MFADLLSILATVILPMALLAGLGFALQRRGGLDLATLTRLNFHVAVPAVVVTALIDADAGHVLDVIGFTLLAMLGTALATIAAAVASGVQRDRWRTLLLATCFWNTGNFSLPLQELAWRSVGLAGPAVAVQSMVMVVQNVLHFTLGTALIAGTADQRARWRAMLLFPPLWAVIAALAVIAVRAALDQDQRSAAATVLAPAWDAVQLAARAFMAVALVTMGAQLAQVRESVLDRECIVASVVRLILGPPIGLAAAWLLGLDGWLAQVLVLSTAAPSAINSVLLCVQFAQHPGLAARSVLLTTLAAPLTAALTIHAVRH